MGRGCRIAEAVEHPCADFVARGFGQAGGVPQLPHGTLPENMVAGFGVEFCPELRR